MIDLKRERALIDELYAGDKGLFYWNDEDTRRIANAIAAARREGAEAALEEAARVCDALYDGYSTANTDQTDPEQVWLDACDRAATAIRALKDKPCLGG